MDDRGAGVRDSAVAASVAPAGPRRQAEVYLRGVAGRRPRIPTDARRLEEAARRRLSAKAYAYLAGGPAPRPRSARIATRSTDALPAIVAAAQGRVPILLDGGIRGGADIVKALALGARAVCVGRPYAFALAVAGQAGVSELLANLVAELDLTLGLAGCRSIAELGPDLLAPPAGA